MRNIKLKAIKRCGRASPGEEFMANSVEAKALVAIGHAERVGGIAPLSAVPEKPVAREPLISKAIREQAEELGLVVASIVGTGKGGRIIRADVEAALAAKQAQGNQ